jgi:hypothetical protein
MNTLQERAPARNDNPSPRERDLRRDATATATASVAIIVGSRDWWVEEAARAATDWDGVIEAHLDVLALLGLVEREARK